MFLLAALGSLPMLILPLKLPCTSCHDCFCFWTVNLQTTAHLFLCVRLPVNMYWFPVKTDVLLNFYHILNDKWDKMVLANWRVLCHGDFTKSVPKTLLKLALFNYVLIWLKSISSTQMFLQFISAALWSSPKRVQMFLLAQCKGILNGTWPWSFYYFPLNLWIIYCQYSQQL